MKLTLADLVERHTVRQCDSCGRRLRYRGPTLCANCRMSRRSAEDTAHYRAVEPWGELAKLWRPVVAVTLKREKRQRKAQLYQHRARLRAQQEGEQCTTN